MNVNPLRIALLGIATGLMILAWILSIICVATDSWLVYDSDGVISASQGLWKTCITLLGQTICTKIGCKLYVCIYSCCYFCLLLTCVYFDL